MPRGGEYAGIRSIFYSDLQKPSTFGIVVGALEKSNPSVLSSRGCSSISGRSLITESTCLSRLKFSNRPRKPTFSFKPNHNQFDSLGNYYRLVPAMLPLYPAACAQSKTGTGAITVLTPHDWNSFWASGLVKFSWGLEISTATSPFVLPVSPVPCLRIRLRGMPSISSAQIGAIYPNYLRPTFSERKAINSSASYILATGRLASGSSSATESSNRRSVSSSRVSHTLLQTPFASRVKPSGHRPLAIHPPHYGVSSTSVMPGLARL